MHILCAILMALLIAFFEYFNISCKFLTNPVYLGLFYKQLHHSVKLDGVGPVDNRPSTDIIGGGHVINGAYPV